MALDIEIATGGFRMAWAARTPRAQEWVADHPQAVADAPQRIEQDYRAVEMLIRQARRDGLHVGLGEDA